MRDSLLPNLTFKIYAASLSMSAITFGLAGLFSDHMGFLVAIAMGIAMITMSAALIVATICSVFSLIRKMVQESKNNTAFKLKPSDVTNLIVSTTTLAILPITANHLFSPIGLIIVIPSVAICLLEGGLRVREYFARNNQAIINQAPKQSAKQASEIVYSNGRVLKWDHTSQIKRAKDNGHVPGRPLTRSQTRRLNSK